MDEPTTPTREGVSAEIRALMGRHKVNQTQLAAAIGLKQSGVSERLNGKTPWNIDELDRVAAYFNVPITTLFREMLDLAA